jgi:hypothetical protein
MESFFLLLSSGWVHGYKSLFIGPTAGEPALDGIISFIEQASERYRDPLLQVEFTRR